MFISWSQRTGKHREGKCQRDFTCKDPYHDRYHTKMHVLVCQDHKDKPENKDLLQKYKDRFINKHSALLPPYSREIQLSYISTAFKNHQNQQIHDTDSKGIYMLQTIKIQDQEFTIFYDTGCGEFVSRYGAIERLGSRAIKEFDGPVILGGVGGICTESRYGVYSVKLPLVNNNEALLTGVCLQQVTQEFPQYPLSGKVENDIVQGYLDAGGNVYDLPKLPKTVGGNVDFMLGIKYLRYFPKEIFKLPSGLTIYRSHFQNADGSRGVIGGPHEVFTNIENHHNLCQQFSNVNFISNQFKIYQNGLQVNPDVPLLGFKNSYQDFNLDVSDKLINGNNDCVMISRKLKIFEKIEEAGTEVNYRCITCRDCKVCKKHADEENMSIKEEVEQDLIEKSVTLDVKNRKTVARLPVLHDPKLMLSPNRGKALKVFGQQLKKMNKNEKDKLDVVQSEMKLQNLGHVEFVRNLPADIQQKLNENPTQNFIPWRAVWKENSLSTPCRMVFDASQPTCSGYSLNDILAKGRNSMNKLVEIFIRWRKHRYGFHTDVRKMYNSVKLDSDDWCLQRYLWKNNLDENEPLEEKVIKTLIYGVRSSGNQAECGLRRTALLSKDEYPKVCKIIHEDVYVDDCLSGNDTKEMALQTSDELELVMNRGGFGLKGITMTGSPPSKDLSSDEVSISVAGLLWQSQDDTISLDVKDLNFAKKQRGRKTEVISNVPEKLTRRQCTSKVAEIFDLTGMFTPIISAMKMDLHELVLRKLDWDDKVPNELQPVWFEHFKMMTDIGKIRFQRAVIPEDAVSTDINLLSFGDASKSCICIAIYARFKRCGGNYSCQLIFGRSKLVPDGLTQPRAELFAALVNCHSTEVVKRSLKECHDGTILFTDSQIVLHWLNNKSRTLKQWVRNRVIEIQRFTTIDDWRYVSTDNMIADLGTRKGVKLDEVSPGSQWVNGLQWMVLDEANFPSFKIHEINLNATQLNEAKKEQPYEFLESSYVQRQVPNQVVERYKFSRYLLDPNKFRFKTVVRVIAFVIKFIKILQSRVKKIEFKYVQHDGIEAAETYFFKKATDEIKHFYKLKQYQNFRSTKGRSTKVY